MLSNLNAKSIFGSKVGCKARQRSTSKGSRIYFCCLMTSFYSYFVMFAALENNGRLLEICKLFYIKKNRLIKRYYLSRKTFFAT